MLSAARDSSRSLLTLIDDILDFSKIEVGKLEIHPEPCSVARLVDGVNATFKHVASGKGLLLTQRIDPALWPAHLIDPSRLRQILTNLVSNAIKFTHSRDGQPGGEGAGDRSDRRARHSASACTIPASA